MALRSQPVSASDVAKFTAAVALAAIFIDASLGHGLTWENDPYWTYWITKTFLIATIFGLGSAWIGMGVVSGAIITVVHTLVLTIYYWTFSPIGLPSTPTWLDLEHTWISGLPIHFAVIYIGYLVALWAWQRRRSLAGVDLEAGPVALRALVVGLAIVVVAGGLASLALGEFPGFTWFLVRLLMTVPFLLAWWGLFGTEGVSGIVGGVVLALMWATYAQFLGPSGLPDTPLRILDPSPPPATVRWLDYRELWVISLPIYLVVSIAAMVLASPREGRTLRRSVAAVALVPIVLFTTGLTVTPEDRGVSATFSAEGDVSVEGGSSGTGEIRIDATDMGNRVTPLPPHDELSVDASFEAGGSSYEITVREPLVEDPAGLEPTWWGIAFDVDYREESGDSVRAELAAFGLGDVMIDGTEVGRGIPVEVIASREQGYGLSLEVGNDTIPIPGGDPEQVSAVWSSFQGSAPEGAHNVRYLVGGIVLLVFLALGLLINRREEDRRVPSQEG